MSDDIENAELNVEEIQQQTDFQIKSTAAALEKIHKDKIDKEQIFHNVAEELARKRTKEGTVAIANDHKFKIDLVSAYNKKCLEEMQKRFDMEKKNLAFASTQEREEYKSNAAYRRTQLFEEFRQGKLDELELAKGHAAEEKRIRKELLDETIKYQRDLREQEYQNEIAEIEAAKERRKNTTGPIKTIQNAQDMGSPIANIGNTIAGVLKSVSVSPKDRLKASADESQKEADALAKKLESAKKDYEAAKESGAYSPEQLAEMLKEGQQLQLEATAKMNEANMKKMASAVVDGLGKEYENQYDKATDILSQYKGSVDARTQGSGLNFDKLSDKISSNLSFSMVVKTTKVIDEMKKAVDQGIAYNVEQRAFLSGISDKIATTFDVFDSNLMRIIRLQQADTTATRMGMEAALTKMFNNMFQDTSYLNGAFDSVTGALVDATSMLSYQASAEFEYVIQKWLGALSSLGLSDNAVTTIAQGINYLATGDVQNLANNSSLQTLFAMAASNANMEYSQILLEGLNADTTNRLLESVVKYLKTIAEESENQVVRRAYGDIFNMSNSDLKAISNLTQAEISYLAGNMMSYSGMEEEINNQLSSVIKRTSFAEILDNIYTNVLYGVAEDMASNPVTFAMQKMLNFMNDTETDIAIPFINVYGFGLDINATVKDLMQMALGIGQAMSLAGNILSALTSGSSGGTNLDSWGASTTTRRGSGGLTLSPTSILGDVSASMGGFSGSGNSEDMKKDSISGATEDSEETKEITNKSSEDEYTMKTLFEETINGTEGKSIRTKPVIDTNTAFSVHLMSIDSSLLNDNPILTSLGLIKTAINSIDSKIVKEEPLNNPSISTTITSNSSVLDGIKTAEGDIEKVSVEMKFPEELKFKLADTESLATAIATRIYDGDKNASLASLISTVLSSLNNGVPIYTPAGRTVEVATATSAPFNP